jgi:hypothetical protein
LVEELTCAVGIPYKSWRHVGVIVELQLAGTVARFAVFGVDLVAVTAVRGALRRGPENDVVGVIAFT